MTRERFTEERIVAGLREHEAGVKTSDLVRSHGVFEAALHNRKTCHGGIDASEAGRLEQCGNDKLKRLLAVHMLDAAALRGGDGSRACGIRVAVAI
ncbi:MAG: transposase [Rhizobiales bacterium]|nr:transposase [Hyphomicrobiales bacterium]